MKHETLWFLFERKKISKNKPTPEFGADADVDDAWSGEVTDDDGESAVTVIEACGGTATTTLGSDGLVLLEGGGGGGGREGRGG